jgi:hypothetical protein
MKEALKDIILPLLVFIGVPILSILLIIALHTEPNKYVGRVIRVSNWDGAASLKTRNKQGDDTIIMVRNRTRERFIEGQIITVWTGGDLIGGIGSTEPQ